MNVPLLTASLSLLLPQNHHYHHQYPLNHLHIGTTIKNQSHHCHNHLHYHNLLQTSPLLSPPISPKSHPHWYYRQQPVQSLPPKNHHYHHQYSLNHLHIGISINNHSNHCHKHLHYHHYHLPITCTHHHPHQY